MGEEFKRLQPSLAQESLVRDDDDDNDADNDGSEEECKEIKEDEGAERINMLSAPASTCTPNIFAEILSEDEESDNETSADISVKSAVSSGLLGSAGSRLSRASRVERMRSSFTTLGASKKKVDDFQINWYIERSKTTSFFH